MNDKKEYIYEYNAIRLIATILVVLGHSAYTTMQTKYGGLIVDVQYSRYQQIILAIVRLIYSFHMPLFIFLAGALYENGVDKGKWKSFGSFVNAKSKRLLIPFAGVMFFWVLPIKLISGYYNGSASVAKDMMLGQIIYFDNCHLWYVVSLFWIFVFAWIIDKYVAQMIKPFVLLVLYSLSMLMPVNFLGLQKAFSYLIYFFIGKLYEKKRTKIYEIQKYIRVLMIAGVLFFAISIYYIYLSIFKNNYLIYSIVALGGIGISVLISLLLKKINFEINSCFVSRTVLDNSYGIYLFADPVNYLVLSFLLKTNCVTIYESGIGCIAIFMFRAIFSSVIAILLQKVLYKIKYIGKKA